MARIVCFGELLLRLSAPGRERLLQSWALDVCVGGAEANVAVSLAGFGQDAAMASVVADGPLGEAALGELRRAGVDVASVVRAQGRVGLYFLETGAVSRPSRIVYDRQDSAFARAAPDAIDWTRALEGADWLHVSGVTPAVGALASQAALRAVEAAVARGVKVCFDGNYRGQMWALWPGDPAGTLRSMLAAASLAFVNERDLALILQRPFEGEGAREAAFAAAFAEFPRLGAIAATTRQQASVADQMLSAQIVTRQGRWESRAHRLDGVVDRIGGGDAFAAGVLHGVVEGWSPQDCVDFGVAAGALKHSVPGDFNRASIEEVREAMAGGSLDVRR